MKRFIPLGIAAAMAITAVGATTASAQNYPGGPPGPPPGYNHPPPPHGPGWGPGPGPGPGPGWHHWHRGDHYHGSRYYVHDWHHYGLRPPPPGYQWVQDGGQFVLIAVATGVITDIILNSR